MEGLGGCTVVAYRKDAEESDEWQEREDGHGRKTMLSKRLQEQLLLSLHSHEGST